MNRWLGMTMFLVAIAIATPLPLQAGTLAELATALQSHYSSGAISDADAYQMLSDLLDEAQLAADVEAENALRGSITDVVNAYKGAGLSDAAADDIILKAQP